MLADADEGGTHVPNLKKTTRLFFMARARAHVANLVPRDPG